VKILIVVHDYLPDHIAGTELHAHQTARELARRGHDVTALFTERDLAAEEGSVRAGELDGVRTLEVVHQREYADVRETYRQARSAEVFARLLAELEPDVVHFHHLAFWGARCLELARERGLAPLVTLHDYYLLCDNSVLLRDDGEPCTDGPRGRCSECLRRHPLLLERWPSPPAEGEDPYALAARERHALHARALRSAAVAVCPSRFLADRFVEGGMLAPDQIRVLKAGYPGPRRAPRRSDSAAPLAVGYVGGIYPSKGVHVLVEAFARLPEGTAAELHLHGVLEWFPEYVAELRAQAGDRPVRFHGRFDPADVDAVLGTLDVLVVPSVWYENMPITIQEAYRNGIPVIATDLGGMAEAVEDGAGGLLFPRGDAAALAERIARLAADRELLWRLARGTPDPPGLEAVTDELEALYRGCSGL